LQNNLQHVTESGSARKIHSKNWCSGLPEKVSLSTNRSCQISALQQDLGDQDFANISKVESSANFSNVRFDSARAIRLLQAEWLYSLLRAPRYRLRALFALHGWPGERVMEPGSFFFFFFFCAGH
jgi:hypothetical protein